MALEVLMSEYLYCYEGREKEAVNEVKKKADKWDFHYNALLDLEPFSGCFCGSFYTVIPRIPQKSTIA